MIVRTYQCMLRLNMARGRWACTSDRCRRYNITARPTIVQNGFCGGGYYCCREECDRCCSQTCDDDTGCSTTCSDCNCRCAVSVDPQRYTIGCNTGYETWVSLDVVVPAVTDTKTLTTTVVDDFGALFFGLLLYVYGWARLLNLVHTRSCTLVRIIVLVTVFIVLLTCVSLRMRTKAPIVRRRQHS